MNPRNPDPAWPALLVVSLLTVLAGVGAVVAVAKLSAGWAVGGAILVLLVGLVLVVRTMNDQLAEDGEGPGH